MNKKLPAVGDLHIHGIVNLKWVYGVFRSSKYKIKFSYENGRCNRTKYKRDGSKIIRTKKANHL